MIYCRVFSYWIKDNAWGKIRYLIFAGCYHACHQLDLIQQKGAVLLPGYIILVILVKTCAEKD